MLLQCCRNCWLANSAATATAGWPTLLPPQLLLCCRNDRLPFAFDLERIVDDFVLFCMLAGNDFLPPLPTSDIAEGEGAANFLVA